MPCISSIEDIYIIVSGVQYREDWTGHGNTTRSCTTYLYIIGRTVLNYVLDLLTLLYLWFCPPAWLTLSTLTRKNALQDDEKYTFKNTSRLCTSEINCEFQTRRSVERFKYSVGADYRWYSCSGRLHGLKYYYQRSKISDCTSILGGI